jgi:hypothetical protein
MLRVLLPEVVRRLPHLCKRSPVTIAIQIGIYSEPSLVQQGLCGTKRVPSASAHAVQRQRTVDNDAKAEYK